MHFLKQYELQRTTKKYFQKKSSNLFTSISLGSQDLYPWIKGLSSQIQFTISISDPGSFPNRVRALALTAMINTVSNTLLRFAQICSYIIKPELCTLLANPIILQHTLDSVWQQDCDCNLGDRFTGLKGLVVLELNTEDAGNRGFEGIFVSRS